MNELSTISHTKVLHVYLPKSNTSGEKIVQQIHCNFASNNIELKVSGQRLTTEGTLCFI